MIYKNKDLEAIVNEKGIDLGNVEVVLYTKDINTASFRIFLKNKINYGNEVFYDPFDLSKTSFKPFIDLISENGSIFTHDPLKIIDAESGVVQYELPSDVVAQAGKMDASVYLESDDPAIEGVEVATFYFYIDDTGLTSRVGRIVNTTIVDDAVARVLSKDAQKLLDENYKRNLEGSLKDYLKVNSELFRGPKGDEGVIKFDNLTEEQKNELKPPINTLPNYLNIDGNFDLTVFQPIAKNEFNGIRYFKDTSDEFMKAMENFVYKLDEVKSIETKNEDFTTVTVGNMNYYQGSDNPYASEIGTTVEHKFTGYSISVTTLTSNVGGMWKASIDGHFIKNISTYGTGKIISTLISDQLENKEHTLTLEYIGQDPEHPVTDARGWLRTGKYNNTFNTFTIVREVTDKTYKRLITPGYALSNKEYAINVRDAVAKGTANFFPMHSNVKTSFQGSNYVRELIVDGEDIPLKTVRKGLYFNEAKLIQKVEHRLPEDTDARMECTFIVTFKDGKVYNDIRFKWLKESEVTSGYVFQMPFDANWFSSVVVDDKEQVNKSTNYGTSSDFNLDNAKIYRGLSNDPVGKDYVYQMTILETALPVYRLWVEHRNKYLQKLYPQYYNVTPRKAGDIDVFRGVYELVKVKDANKVYSV